MHLYYQISTYFAFEGVVLAILFSLAFAFVAGAIIERVMGDLSFGLFGNAFLVLLGIGIANFVAPANVGAMTTDEVMRICMLASSISIALLLTLSGLKRYLADI